MTGTPPGRHRPPADARRLGREGRQGELRYEVRVAEHLQERWTTWFEGFALTHAGDGTTTLSGPVADQAALHGLLRQVRDLGMTLVSVRLIDEARESGGAPGDRVTGSRPGTGAGSAGVGSAIPGAT